MRHGSCPTPRIVADDCRRPIHLTSDAAQGSRARSRRQSPNCVRTTPLLPCCYAWAGTFLGMYWVTFTALCSAVSTCSSVITVFLLQGDRQESEESGNECILTAGAHLMVLDSSFGPKVCIRNLDTVRHEVWNAAKRGHSTFGHHWFHAGPQAGASDTHSCGSRPKTLTASR